MTTAPSPPDRKLYGDLADDMAAEVRNRRQAASWAPSVTKAGHEITETAVGILPGKEGARAGITAASGALLADRTPDRFRRALGITARILALECEVDAMKSANARLEKAVADLRGLMSMEGLR